MKISKAGAVTWQCEYDALGNRSRVIDNGVTREYVHDPAGLGNAIAEYGATELIRRYIFGAILAADQDSTGRKRYYLQDTLTSTIALTDEAGEVVGRTAYDSFGGIATSSGETSQFAFVGGLGVVNDGNHLLFMKNRYYSCQEGRFIQLDPLGITAGDPNYYNYCSNEPITLIDPLGEQAVVCKQLTQKYASNRPANAPTNNIGLTWQDGCIIYVWIDPSLTGTKRRLVAFHEQNRVETIRRGWLMKKTKTQRDDWVYMQDLMWLTKNGYWNKPIWGETVREWLKNRGRR
jgi:RHS repeat-associated protein